MYHQNATMQTYRYAYNATLTYTSSTIPGSRPPTTKMSSYSNPTTPTKILTFKDSNNNIITTSPPFPRNYIPDGNGWIFCHLYSTPSTYVMDPSVSQDELYAWQRPTYCKHGYCRRMAGVLPTAYDAERKRKAAEWTRSHNQQYHARHVEEPKLPKEVAPVQQETEWEKFMYKTFETKRKIGPWTVGDSKAGREVIHDLFWEFLLMIWAYILFVFGLIVQVKRAIPWSDIVRTLFLIWVSYKISKMFRPGQTSNASVKAMKGGGWGSGEDNTNYYRYESVSYFQIYSTAVWDFWKESTIVTKI